MPLLQKKSNYSLSHSESSGPENGTCSQVTQNTAMPSKTSNKWKSEDKMFEIIADKIRKQLINIMQNK
jgi:hypothetical protein